MPGTTLFPATALDSHIDAAPYGFVEAVNFLATTVNGTINTGDATIPVASTIGFPPRGLVSIDTEVIAYAGKTTTTFTGCTRGFDGTVAASHTTGATVAVVPTAATHNDLAAAIVAVETKLGLGASVPGGTAAVLRRTAAGSSGWGQVVGADVAGGGAANRVLATVDGTTAAMQLATTDMLAAGAVTQSAMNLGTGSVGAGGALSDAPIAAITLTTVGGRIVAILAMSVLNHASGGVTYGAIQVDGVDGPEASTHAVSVDFTGALVVMAHAAPAAGSHTVKARWRAAAGGSNLNAGWLLVMELKR